MLARKTAGAPMAANSSAMADSDFRMFQMCIRDSLHRHFRDAAALDRHAGELGQDRVQFRRVS